MLSEKKILNETKNRNPPPFKLNGRSLKSHQVYDICIVWKVKFQFWRSEMANNSNNISTTNNYISPQIVIHKLRSRYTQDKITLYTS
jgi:hypothetical protein